MDQNCYFTSVGGGIGASCIEVDAWPTSTTTQSYVDSLTGVFTVATGSPTSDGVKFRARRVGVVGAFVMVLLALCN